eukprot:TRINITY_DN67634_c1_g1_i1.p1 TRINITY_DN67634_c1_g1~~TRINITY_DN67634_c1_g1_i1.p1  ORF type:complete len:596 (-),score=10.26 TRINITY_DN67634_c1_g1_i1:241-2028(-)
MKGESGFKSWWKAACETFKQQHPYLADREYQWIILNFVVILYSMVALPYRLCFDRGGGPGFLVIDILGDLVLIIEVTRTFFTPFNRDGFIVRDRWAIAVRYLKSHFVFDLITILPLDLLVLAVPSLRRPGFLVPPYLRLNKLLRVNKLSRYFVHFEKTLIWSPNVIRLIKYTCIVMLLAHWTASAYFLVARVQEKTHPVEVMNWTFNPGLADASAGYQYVLALYWALTMMTGYGTVGPVTDLQVIFSLSTVVMGVAFYVLIIGSVGQLVTNLDGNRAIFRSRMDAMMDYMRFRNFPESLNRRVLDYYEYLWNCRRGLDEAAILMELPNSLREEVALYLNKDIVKKVPLFKDCAPRFINAIAVSLQPFIALPETYVIRKGEVGREMFFISSGEVNVVSEDGETVFATLRSGSFFGEVALLKETRRTASVKTVKFCDLFMLAKEDFDYLMEKYPEDSSKIVEAANKRQQLAEEKQRLERQRTRIFPSASTNLSGSGPGTASTSDTLSVPNSSKTSRAGSTGSGGPKMRIPSVPPPPAPPSAPDSTVLEKLVESAQNPTAPNPKTTNLSPCSSNNSAGITNSNPSTSSSTSSRNSRGQ